MTTHRKKSKVGIVGCGAIAAPHVTTLKALSQDESLAEIEIHLFDLEVTSAKNLNEKYELGAVIHDSFESMLEASIDSLHILTPPSSHFNLASQALKERVNVLVEKPFTIHLNEAQELYDIAEDRGLMLCVDHSTLFMPNVRAMLERIRSGEFGRPVAFHCFYGHAESKGKIPYKDPKHWAYRTEGGLLINHISHPASLLVELMGSPKSIKAQSTSQTILPDEMPDSLTMSILCENGMGTITVAMAQGNHHRHATIWCEKGTIALDLTRQTIVESKHNGPIGLVDKMMGGVMGGLSQVSETISVGFKVASKKLKREPGVRALVEEFTKALCEGSEAPVSRENALGVQQIIEESLFENEG